MSAPTRFGPFYLDSRIAVGGTAEVYLAHPVDPKPGEPERLVVKRLLPHFASDPEGRTMFEREAALHASISHENVVTVFHAGTDDKGEPYLAMEYVDGVDGYRLLRKLRQEDELLPVGVAVFVAREVLRALESVHGARDPQTGTLLGIVHRDVSPSNIYLSKEGRVKLGDFGIARSTSRTTLRSEAGHVLKGKFAYLAPEQVAGEDADHRADLFSLGTVLAEMLLNRPLFPGGGQLAILLAIRDCKIDALLEAMPRLPPGFYDVMKKALARRPDDRFATATDFANALAPFESDPRLAAKEIAARVRWVQTSSSSDRVNAVRQSVAAMRAVRPIVATPPPAAPPPPEEEEEDETPDARKTSEYTLLPSFVVRSTGEKLGPWTFARVMEALATGQLQQDDQIDFVGRGFGKVADVEEFARFFPASTATTGKVSGPGSPDFLDQIGSVSMLQTLMRVLAQRETGVLFAERAEDTGESGRKELYFVAGKLHHVASSNASELLGEYLVRRGKLEREELDLALAVLPRYGGRMGDTLISMGLVGPVDIFRAIREQGRDRVADLFLWKGGTLTFYRGQTAPHVEFPLDLELPPLMLAGIEVAKPGESAVDGHRSEFDKVLVSANGNDDLFTLDGIAWPPLVTRIQSLLGQPMKLRDLLKTAHGISIQPGDTMRAVEILLAAGLFAWR